MPHLNALVERADTAFERADDERGDGVTGKLAAAGVLAAFEKQPEKRMFNPCGAESGSNDRSR